ncbi:MAG: Methyltransferase domain protein [Methanosaeta sp. PtaU1.Bin112]|nr:MAG: Methyltransferase domain protein [Methanosaeta sp. PtaU1.Bin112]
MSTISQSWQSIWQSAINCSSLKHRMDRISEKERLNLTEETWYKKMGYKINLDDQQKTPAFEEQFSRFKRFVTKDSTVLDIGAGFGRLAIPLAKEVHTLTAIEPVRVYMNVMKDRAARDGVSNMQFSEDLWSDFPLHEKYDLVYSTWSTAVKDPATLMKMHEASRGYCVLETRATPLQKLEFFGQIYPMIVGEEFRPPGNYLNFITTLYDHGIYANVKTWRFDREERVQTMDDAVDFWKINLGKYTEINGEADEKLKHYYRTNMNQDGSHTFNYKEVYCMVWWKV